MAISLPQLAALTGGSAVPAVPGPKGLRGSQETADFSNLLAMQIPALLQTTAPAATTPDRIASKLTDAIIKASGKTADANARSTLQRALTAALAPPGTSPPQTATLEQRLIGLLTTLTGTADTSKTAGQKNDIPGQLLDAKAAKESPAPQRKPVRDLPIVDGITVFARDLLAFATTAAQSAPVQSTPATATPQDPAPDTAPAASAAGASNDVLARIIARAVNAGAQHQTNVPASANPSATSTTSGAVLFERLVAAIAQISQGANSGSDSGSQDGAKPQSQQQTLQAPGDPASAGTTPASALTVTHVTGAPPSAAPVTRGPVSYSTLDPNAVIEQIVKGIVIQGTGGSSQIRLRLQPEHLGEVSLKLTVTGNSISASVVAQSASVRDLLLSGQSQLNRSLSDAGLTLGNFSVDVSGNNAGFTGGQHQAQQNRQPGFKLGGWEAALALNDDQQEIDPRFGPSIATGARSMVINSLV